MGDAQCVQRLDRLPHVPYVRASDSSMAKLRASSHKSPQSAPPPSPPSARRSRRCGGLGRRPVCAGPAVPAMRASGFSTASSGRMGPPSASSSCTRRRIVAGLADRKNTRPPDSITSRFCGSTKAPAARRYDLPLTGAQVGDDLPLSSSRKAGLAVIGEDAVDGLAGAGHE